MSVCPMSGKSSTTPPPIAVMHVATAYTQSFALSAVCKMKIADILVGGPKHVSDLAQATGANEDSLYRLLRGVVGIGIFSELDGRLFANNEASEFLRPDHPSSMYDIVQMFTSNVCVDSWKNLSFSIRTGKPAFDEVYGMPVFEHYKHNPDQFAEFSRSMSNVSSLEMLSISTIPIPVHDGDVVVDIGGSHGDLLRHVLMRNERTTGILYDLENVVEEFRPLQAAVDAHNNLTGRYSLASGDFFVSAPVGDVYIIKHILHDWSNEQCISILKAIRASIRPNGRVLIFEMIIGDKSRPCPAYLDLHMMLLTTGRERTAEEFSALLAASGFEFKSIASPAAGLMYMVEAHPV